MIFLTRFDLGSHSIAGMVNGVTNQYSTREKLEEVGLETDLYLVNRRIFCVRVKNVSIYTYLCVLWCMCV